MGNLYAESGLMPNNLQNAYNNKLGKTDAEYTAAVDNGSYGNFVKDSAGYGLAQWTYWSRKQALLNHAKQAGVSIADLNMQLGFLWEELQGYTAVMDTLKKAGSVRAASDAVLTGYEKPADQSETAKKKRAEYGEGYYKKYAAGNGTKYYRVRKSWTDAASQLGRLRRWKMQRALARRVILYMMITARRYIPQRGSRQAQAFRLAYRWIF